MAYTPVFGAFTPSTNDATLTSVLAMTRMGTNILTADARLLLRDVRKEVWDQSQDDDFLSLMEWRGQVIPAETPDIFHYESGDEFRPAEIATVSGATATAATITITAGSYVTINGGNYPPLTTQDSLMISSSAGYVHARVVSKSNLTPTNGRTPTHTGEGSYGAQTETYVLERIGGTGSLATAAIVGAQIAFYGSSMNSGDYLKIEGKYKAFLQNTAQFQILDDYCELTGEAANTRYGFELRGKSLVYDVQEDAMLRRFRMQWGFTHWFSPGGTTTSGVKLTTGIIARLQNFGQNFGYTGTFDSTDLLDLIQNIKAQSNVRSYTIWGGPNVIAGFYAAVRSLAPNGGIVYNYGNLAETLEARFDFEKITLNGVTFFVKETNAFNYRNVTGAANLPYRDMMVLVPNANMDRPNKDGSITSSPQLTLRYIPRTTPTGAKVRYREVPGGPETNGRDVRSMAIYSQETHQMLGARNFFLVTKAGA